jgi:hypothetical protein
MLARPEVTTPPVGEAWAKAPKTNMSAHDSLWQRSLVTGFSLAAETAFPAPLTCSEVATHVPVAELQIDR